MTSQQINFTSLVTSSDLKPPITQFREAIIRRGLAPPSIIEPDGNRHYFSSNGETGNRAGWYEYQPGDIAFGSFGNVRTGLKEDAWVADMGRPLTPEEESGIAKKRQDHQADQKFRRENLQNSARSVAAKVMEASMPAPDTHPYLAKKKIKAHGIAFWEDAFTSVEYSSKTQKPFVRLVTKNGQASVVFGLEPDEKSEEQICQDWKNVLIIPMRDEEGAVQSVHFIASNGERRSLYGGKLQGGYFVLGELDNSAVVILAKTFANAATIHEITGHPVVVTFEAENLPTVAKIIRKQKPDASIILCADDDYKSKDNPGLTKAAQAVRLVGGALLVPEFGNDRPDHAVDFNDMAAHLGEESVRKIFTGHSLVKDPLLDAKAEKEAQVADAVMADPPVEEPTPERPVPSSKKKRKMPGWGFTKSSADPS